MTQPFCGTADKRCLRQEFSASLRVSEGYALGHEHHSLCSGTLSFNSRYSGTPVKVLKLRRESSWGTPHIMIQFALFINAIGRRFQRCLGDIGANTYQERWVSVERTLFSRFSRWRGIILVAYQQCTHCGGRRQANEMEAQKMNAVLFAFSLQFTLCSTNAPNARELRTMEDKPTECQDNFNALFVSLS